MILKTQIHVHIYAYIQCRCIKYSDTWQKYQYIPGIYYIYCQVLQYITVIPSKNITIYYIYTREVVFEDADLLCHRVTFPALGAECGPHPGGIVNSSRNGGDMHIWTWLNLNDLEDVIFLDMLGPLYDWYVALGCSWMLQPTKKSSRIREECLLRTWLSNCPPLAHPKCSSWLTLSFRGTRQNLS